MFIEKENINNHIKKVEDWSVLPNNPIVTVEIATYNHESYIRNTLESVLMQQVNFEYEILIKEDNSTDNTKQIVLEYQKQYPNKFRVWLAKKNIYQQGIKLGLYRFARGKYIAKLDGDDYWIDSFKLQKQIDFLETNPDYNFSVGGYNTIDEKGVIKKGELLKKSSSFLIRDYIANRFSQTSTFVYRKTSAFPEWISKMFAGDQALLLLASVDKKIKYHNEILSVYRLHARGIDTLNKNFVERNKKYIFLLEKIKSLTNDWKCKLIIKLKTHVISIKNYSFNRKYTKILKLYTVLNRIVIPQLNNLLNWF
jgi:glycosyltransferase involved in cell wall biosynthesis